jgi:hypothetical protein
MEDNQITRDETTDGRRAANAPVADHPAGNTAPPSNPETEQDSVAKGEEKMERLSTH